MFSLAEVKSRRVSLPQITVAVVILIQLVSNIIWYRVQQAPPTWDSAGHLSLSYLFLEMFPRFLRGDAGVLDLLKISDYYPPFVHFVGAFVYAVFGRNYIFPLFIVQGLFYALSAIYLYKIVAKITQHPHVAALTVIFYSLFPGVWGQIRQYHLDIPLVALLLMSYFYLISSDSLRDKKNAYLFFLFISLAQLTKWYAVVYIFAPFVIEGIIKPWRQGILFDKERLRNIVYGALFFTILSVPWYVVNFKHIVETFTITSTGEIGDPSETLSFESIFHYMKMMVSHQIMFVTFIYLVLAIKFVNQRSAKHFADYLSFITLFPYLVFTVIQNKDIRYILPLTPIFAFYIAYFVSYTQRRVSSVLAIGLGGYLSLLFVVLSFNQFPSMMSSAKFFYYFAGGPYYTAWVADPRYYSYSPNHNYIPEIINEIEERVVASGNQSRAAVLELSDSSEYSYATFDLVRIQKNYTNFYLQVPYFEFEPFTPEELKNYLATVSFAVVPDDPGPWGLRNRAVLSQLISHFKSGNSGFSEVRKYPISETNSLTLYVRTNFNDFKDPSVAKEHIVVNMGGAMHIEKSALKGAEFDVILTDSSGVDKTWRVTALNDEVRIPLNSITKVKVGLEPNRISARTLLGWTYKDSVFSKALSASSLDRVVYENLRLVQVSQSEPRLEQVSVTHDDKNVQITLNKDFVPEGTSFIAYATRGWVWANATLSKDNPTLTLNIEDLVQLEVTSPAQDIRGFSDNWVYFPCYEGRAVCFYPYIENYLYPTL